jgi:hypothetical protein
MTDSECEIAFERLRVALEQHDLSWVTHQVAEQIAFGQISVKRVSSRPEAPEHLILTGLTETPRKQRVTVSATRPYSAHEQLALLLDALEDVVLETDAMASTLRLYMNEKQKNVEKMRNWEEIRLVRSDDGDQSVSITPKPDLTQAQARGQLRTLVTALRARLSDGNAT